ncbi:MAG: hypothetical protein K0S61_676 [Anaerocolumna sp.]|jgi:hypothetical protein|nr:hypothetical protein [Anaerocolumna sp.]
MVKDKKDLSNIENKLKNYFLKDQKILNIDNRIKVLKDIILELEEQIKNVDVNVPVEISSPTWEERVQTSPTGMSQAERSLFRIIDAKITELDTRKIELCNLERRRRDVLLDYSVLDTNIGLLDEESLKLLRMRYKDNKTDTAISIEMNIEQSWVNRKRKKLLENIATWEKWVI